MVTMIHNPKFKKHRGIHISARVMQRDWGDHYWYREGDYFKYGIIEPLENIHKEFIIETLKFINLIKKNDCQIPEYNKLRKIFPEGLLQKGINAINVLDNKDYTDPLYAVNEHLKYFYKFEYFHRWGNDRLMIKIKKPPYWKDNLISGDWNDNDNDNYNKFTKTNIYKLLNDFSKAANYKKIDIENIDNKDVNIECYGYKKIEKQIAETWNNVLEKDKELKNILVEKHYEDKNEDFNLAEHFYKHYCYYYFDRINKHLKKHWYYFDRYITKVSKVNIEYYMERYFNKFSNRNNNDDDNNDDNDNVNEQYNVNEQNNGNMLDDNNNNNDDEYEYDYYKDDNVNEQDSSNTLQPKKPNRKKVTKGLLIEELKKNTQPPGGSKRKSVRKRKSKKKSRKARKSRKKSHRAR